MLDIEKLEEQLFEMQDLKNPLPRYPEKKESLNRHFVTGGIKPEKKAMLLLVRILFLMTGAHRINF